MHEREVHCTIASNVTVVEGITTQSTCQQSGDCALDAIVSLPAHHLVPSPKQRGPSRTPPVACPHEKYQFLFAFFVVVVVVVIKNVLPTSTFCDTLLHHTGSHRRVQLCLLFYGFVSLLLPLFDEFAV